MLLKKNVREKNNFFVRFINEKASALFNKCYAHRKLSIGLASIVAVVGLWMFTLLGTEFLPQLNEGSIYIRATLPPKYLAGRIGETRQSDEAQARCLS